jgi:hypothetical protein
MTLSVLRPYSVIAKTINVYWAAGGMRIGRGNQCSWRIQAAVPICQSQIPHDLNGYRTRAAEVWSWRLIARGVATENYRLWAGWWMNRGSFPSRTEIFLFSTASRPALGLTQPPVQWVAGILYLGIKEWSGREADQRPPSGCEVKNAYNCFFIV